MIQAIFFDVDGTLVSFRTHTIPASTLEALHTLRAKGIKLFLATGRHQAMLRSVQELFPFDGCVTLSGQYCFVGDRVLRSSPMPPEAVEELVAAAEGNTFSSIFLEGEDIYLNCVNDLTRQFIQDLYIPMPPVRPARYALGREIYQAVTFLSREQEHLLLDRAPHLKTTRWHPNFLDVIPPTGGKDLGMDAILPRQITRPHRWTRMELPVPCPTSACSPEPESSSPNQPKFTNCYWNYPRIRCTI